MRALSVLSLLALLVVASGARAQQPPVEAPPTGEAPAGAEEDGEPAPADGPTDAEPAETTEAESTEAEATEASEAEPTDEAQPPDDAGAAEEPPPIEGPTTELPPYEIPKLTERAVLMSTPQGLLGEAMTFWLELGLSSGGASSAHAIAFGSELGMRYRVADFFAADISFGLTYAATNVSGEATIGGTPMSYARRIHRVEPGNPTLRGLFIHRDEHYLLEIGLAMAIPTAARADLDGMIEGVAQREASTLANRAAMSMRGYRGAWRWAPERFSLALPFRIAFRIAPLVIDVDAALAALIPVLGDRNVDADIVVELGAGVGAAVAGPLHLGARIAGVGAALGDTLPAFTLSLEPFARLDFDPVHVSARAFLNLSGDDGLGADRGPAYGIFVSVGGTL